MEDLGQRGGAKCKGWYQWAWLHFFVHKLNTVRECVGGDSLVVIAGRKRDSSWGLSCFLR